MADVGQIFRTVLNQHGYGFQYRVMEEAKSLFEGLKSRWIFEVAEFPVTVRGRDARIDFILRLAESQSYLIAECKRVNPALSNWCFARAPYVTRNPSSGMLVFAHARIDGNANLKVGVSQENSDNIYHISFEVSSGEKGEERGGSRGAIEKAAEQVLLGLNGMIEFMSSNKLLVNLSERRLFIPVIFTTANLLTTELDLSDASLERGEFTADTATLTAKPWIWLQYHQSPTLKHSSPRFDHPLNFVDPKRPPAPGLGDILENEYVRSIAIVNPTGIASFLGRDWWFNDR